MKPLDYSEELNELTKERLKIAQQYADERREYGKCKSEIDVMYASKIAEINDIKRNAGYETGLLILIGMMPVWRGTYKEMITAEQNYKALEKILDALESKIMTIQSQMKYNITQEVNYESVN